MDLLIQQRWDDDGGYHPLKITQSTVFSTCTTYVHCMNISSTKKVQPATFNNKCLWRGAVDPRIPSVKIRKPTQRPETTLHSPHRENIPFTCHRGIYPPVRATIPGVYRAIPRQRKTNGPVWQLTTTSHSALRKYGDNRKRPSKIIVRPPISRKALENEKLGSIFLVNTFFGVTSSSYHGKAV